MDAAEQMMRALELEQRRAPVVVEIVEVLGALSEMRQLKAMVGWLQVEVTRLQLDLARMRRELQDANAP